MKFINANKLHRESGGMGHPSFVREPGTQVLFLAGSASGVLQPAEPDSQPPNILPILFARAQPHIQGQPKSERISG